MRKVILVVALASATMLAGCGGGGKGGVFAGRSGPDEFAVARRAPLVIPPDFSLTPPKPGAPRPQEADSSTQALSAMFGGTAQRSPGENAILSGAGPSPEAGIRTDVGGADTSVVDKGSVTRDIIAAPAGNGAEATVSTPQ